MIFKLILSLYNNLKIMMITIFFIFLKWIMILSQLCSNIDTKSLLYGKYKLIYFLEIQNPSFDYNFIQLKIIIFE